MTNMLCAIHNHDGCVVEVLTRFEYVPDPITADTIYSSSCSIIVTIIVCDASTKGPSTKHGMRNDRRNGHHGVLCESTSSQKA